MPTVNTFFCACLICFKLRSSVALCFDESNTFLFFLEASIHAGSCFTCKQHTIKLVSTVMFPSFQTDRSGQTVQTQIRVYTVCNSLCIFWMHYSKDMPSCSTFRVITINFRVSEILGFLRYWDTWNYCCNAPINVFPQRWGGRITLGN